MGRALVLAVVALTLVSCREEPREDDRRVWATQEPSPGAPKAGKPPVAGEPVDAAEAARATEQPAPAATGEGKPIDRVGGEVSRPELIHRVPLDVARLNAIRASGVPILEAVIAESGTVESVRMLRSTDPELDAMLLDTVRQWRFRPAMKDGKPVRVYYTMVVHRCPQ